MPYLHKSRPVWPCSHPPCCQGQTEHGFTQALWGGQDVPPALTYGSPDRRKKTGDCYVKEVQIGSSPSLLHTQRLPSPQPDGQAPREKSLGAFLFPVLIPCRTCSRDHNFCTRILFVETVIDMLLFHLSIVLVNVPLHRIEYH